MKLFGERAEVACIKEFFFPVVKQSHTRKKVIQPVSISEETTEERNQVLEAVNVIK